MENVSITVFPVREIHRVGAVEIHWSITQFRVKTALVGLLAILTVMNHPLSSVQVHLVRVDNLGLLLHVKGLLVVLGVGIFALKFFLVVRISLGGVWVPHKSVVASSALAIQMVTDWHLLN